MILSLHKFERIKNFVYTIRQLQIFVVKAAHTVYRAVFITSLRRKLRQKNYLKSKKTNQSFYLINFLTNVVVKTFL